MNKIIFVSLLIVGLVALAQAQGREERYFDWARKLGNGIVDAAEGAAGKLGLGENEMLKNALENTRKLGNSIVDKTEGLAGGGAAAEAAPAEK